MINCLQLQTPWKNPILLPSSSFSSSFHISHPNLFSIETKVSNSIETRTRLGNKKKRSRTRRGDVVVCGFLLPVDPWAPNIDSQSIASQLFAFSLFPYIGFLYYLTKSHSTPKLTLFGFYFLLAFVGATIPAGIYAKVHYGTSLSNVDWLHGGAESLLTLSNLFVVLGLRKALRKEENAKENKSSSSSEIEKEKPSI